MEATDFGIEFEYMMVDLGGDEPGRIRDFSNLPYEAIAPLVSHKQGLADTNLATGDLGIKAGYWYLEGDERFESDGRFRTLAVKGIEIRTPPLSGPEAAVDRLQAIERQLAGQLAGHGLGLAIAGFNPVRPRYRFEPPLNAWEQDLRNRHHGYDGSLVSTLSYGPDINLSFPDRSLAHALDAARKLNAYAPYIVPFSFSSPFFADAQWPGLSKRTYERAALRPAVKFYVDPELADREAKGDRLVHPARIPREVGRIEFKAFDAFLDADVLCACCHLLVGICLSPHLPMRSDTADVGLYRRAALHGFEDGAIARQSRLILDAAVSALGRRDAHRLLEPLFRMLEARQTPAHTMLKTHRRTGRKYQMGGLSVAEPLPV